VLKKLAQLRGSLAAALAAWAKQRLRARLYVARKTSGVEQCGKYVVKILDAAETAKREPTAEERSQFDAYMADADAIEQRYVSHERLILAEHELRQGQGRQSDSEQPGNIDGERVRPLSALEGLVDEGVAEVVLALEQTPSPLLSEQLLRLQEHGLDVVPFAAEYEQRLQRVPIEQKRIVMAAIRAGRPAITATQMLQSMVSALRPTAPSVPRGKVKKSVSCFPGARTTICGPCPVRKVRPFVVEGRSVRFPSRLTSMGRLSVNGWPVFIWKMEAICQFFSSLPAPLELPPVSNAHALTVNDKLPVGGTNRYSKGKLPSVATRSVFSSITPSPFWSR
jgi:hypothetical protein